MNYEVFPLWLMGTQTITDFMRTQRTMLSDPFGHPAPPWPEQFS